jgi:hypothetical protein
VLSFRAPRDHQLSTLSAGPEGRVILASPFSSIFLSVYRESPISRRIAAIIVKKGKAKKLSLCVTILQ